jgi:hypothetical protein
MKFKLVLVSVLAVSLVSCSDKSPASVALQFDKNLNQGKLEKAKFFVTEPSVELLELVAATIKVKPDYDVTVFKDSIADNYAYITLKAASGDTLAPLWLVNVDDQWKVDLVAMVNDLEKKRKLARIEAQKKEAEALIKLRRSYK